MASEVNFAVFQGIDFVGQFKDVDTAQNPILRVSYSGEFIQKCDFGANIPIQIVVLDALTGLNQLEILGTGTDSLREGIYKFSIKGIHSVSLRNEIIIFGSIRLRKF